MDIPVWTVIGWLFAPAFTAVLGMYVERKKRDRAKEKEEEQQRKKHDEAVDRALKATLRKDLVDAHEKYVTGGAPLTVERRHEITESYLAYKDLGGNGTGQAMYEAICEVPITIVR